jgi:AraC-like DNA-binding protein
MHRFLQLLSQEGRVKHPIDFYADRLCVSAGYVSTMVKRHSGMTALQWIDRALVREAKVLLHHTQMPVAEVAETLGFATPSFFIRFFRQQTGTTPLQYRKQA